MWGYSRSGTSSPGRSLLTLHPLAPSLAAPSTTGPTYSERPHERARGAGEVSGFLLCVHHLSMLHLPWLPGTYGFLCLGAGEGRGEDGLAGVGSLLTISLVP